MKVVVTVTNCQWNLVLIETEACRAAVANDNEDDLVVIYNRVPKTGSTSFVGVARELCAKNRFHVIHLDVIRYKRMLSAADQVRAGKPRFLIKRFYVF